MLDERWLYCMIEVMNTALHRWHDVCHMRLWAGGVAQ